LYWLNAGKWIGFLIMGTVYAVRPFDEEMVAPIAVSVLLLACTLSLLVRHPFTMQFSRPKVLEQVANSQFFMDMNTFLTQIWFVLFVVMTASAWLAWALKPSISNAAEIILGTVVTIVVPILGMKSMPFISKWYMAQHPPPSPPPDEPP
jgi:tryptophan-rich sensory protein